MLDLLGHFANILSLDFFKPLHRAVQWVLSRLVLWLLTNTLGGTWKLRRSITQKGAYHLLLSDIDLALILPLDADSEHVTKMLKSYQKYRRIYKFLGELELYFSHEWDEKLKLEKEYGALLSFVRDFRKKRWQEIELEKYRDLYHKQKARRSLEKISLALGDVDSQLVKILRVYQLAWLKELPAESSEYVYYYDRELPGQLKPETSQFFKYIAVRQKSIFAKASDPLYFNKKIIHFYELLNYQAYFRVKEQNIYAFDDWIQNLENDLGIKSSRVHQNNSELRTILLSELLKEHTIPNESEIFEVELNETQHTSYFLSDGQSPPPSEEFLDLELQVLVRSRRIRSLNPGYSLWLKTIYPDLTIKLLTDYSEFHKSIELISKKKISTLKPAKKTLSWIAPLNMRFGSQRLANLIFELERLAGDDFIVEIWSPIAAQEPEFSSDFFSDLGKSKSELVVVDQPSGVIIIPTIYSFEEDLNWIRQAQKTGLPVVAGYNSRFEQRIFESFATQSSSVELSFSYLRNQ